MNPFETLQAEWKALAEKTSGTAEKVDTALRSLEDRLDGVKSYANEVKGLVDAKLGAQESRLQGVLSRLDELGKEIQLVRAAADPAAVQKQFSDSLAENQRRINEWDGKAQRMVEATVDGAAKSLNLRIDGVNRKHELHESEMATLRKACQDVRGAVEMLIQDFERWTRAQAIRRVE